MIFPKLSPPKLSYNTVSSFGGIDRTAINSDNCFFNTKNTTSDHFPLLSPRDKKTTLFSTDSIPLQLYTSNGITYILDNNLYYNGVIQFDGIKTNEKKQIVSMGNNIIIFPDNYYFNTLNLDENGISTDKGFLFNKHSTSSDPITLIPCLLDSPIPTYSPEPPEFFSDGDLWLNTSTRPNQLMIYSFTSKSWTNISPSHICIRFDKINVGFNIGDCVSIEGLGYGLDGFNIIADISDNEIIISGDLSSLAVTLPTEDSPFSISRDIPLMDFVCEHQNRLYGCRYGKNLKGEFVNEIYASKLGDPTNWNVFQGISTDSYAASCGSEGEWTGIIPYMGYVFFFKENRVHKLYGTKPSNFTIYDDYLPGIKKGSDASLCLSDGILFYHSKNGIYAYSGSSPTLISKPLGNLSFSNAVGAVSQKTYYICLTDNNGKRNLYTFDFEKNIWHTHNSDNYLFLAHFDGNVVGFKSSENKYVFELLQSSNIPDLCSKLYGESLEKEPDFEWFAETGVLGLSIDNCKYINKLKLKFDADRGSTISVHIQLDSNNLWEECGKFTSSKLKTYVLDILPPRCDHFKLRLSGKGNCKIYSLTKVLESAGEVI